MAVRSIVTTNQVKLAAAVPAARAALRWSLPMRLGFDVAVVAALSLASLVPLPGLAEDALAASRRAGASRAVLRIGSLGVSPVVWGFVIVECVALIVPSLRGMRLGGPSGRAKVGRAALLLSAACAFFEAFRQAMYFEGQGWVLVPGWPSRLLICATLAGFTMILILGIAAMERWGFGSALSIWLLWYAFLDVGPHVAFFHWDRETFVVVAKIVLVAAIASWIVRASAKPAGADGRSSLALPVLASGTAPVIFVATLLTLPPVPKPYFHALDELLPRLPDIGPRTVLALELGAASLATVVLSRLFQAPRRVTRVIARAEALKGRHDVDLVTIKAQASRLLWVTTAKSLLFIVMAELLLLTSPRAPQAWFNAIWFWPFIGPAIAFDLFDEWRARRRHPDLVSVWPEHRPYAAHAARTILEQANIVVLLRGLHHRTCLQFFGPYVPVDIMVPAAYAEQALSLLNGVLDERFGSPVADTIAVSPRSR